MTRWDAITIAGGMLLPLGIWWIFPPAATVVLALELLALGILMDAKGGSKRQ